MILGCVFIVLLLSVRNALKVGLINKNRVRNVRNHPVQQTDFVKCRLADKLVEFIEISKLNSCSNHSKETPRVYCSTCKKYVCFKCILINGQHIDHEYTYIDEDYKKILRLNHKLLGFIRKRCKNNQDNLAGLELAIQTLLNDHSENLRYTNTFQQTTDLLIKEAQHLFDDYQQKKQICIDVIKMDESIVKDIEQRLDESKSLSDQEEILQILQQHIPSIVE
ncbi:unnamed protein product [Rotaria sp. Silwood2]|nr:unnamed protein product [Rotaria sp. Silwood2]CAF2758539.1 unnamed protein product [Rotaria sp. Silwood2]CAF2928675.1 unnamed protein product [Rotaria sp. Silwood2]